MISQFHCFFFFKYFYVLELKAEIAREAGALTVGVVTKPFGFEGRRRMQQALGAIDRLRETVDTLIIVSNDRLLQIIPENTPLQRLVISFNY